MSRARSWFLWSLNFRKKSFLSREATEDLRSVFAWNQLFRCGSLKTF